MDTIKLTFRTRVILSSIYLNFDLNLTNSGQYYLNIAAKLANPAEKQLNANLKPSGAECEIKDPWWKLSCSGSRRSWEAIFAREFGGIK